MIGMRSHTPIALPGGYGQEDGWFDCQGLSAVGTVKKMAGSTAKV